MVKGPNDPKKAYSGEELALWNQVWAAAFVEFAMNGNNDQQSGVGAADLAHRAVLVRRKLFRAFT
jgi:hypothetical protein